MFIQPDWLDPTEPDVGTNRYSYSFNDPVNRSDPTGNFAPAIAALGWGIAAIAGMMAANEASDALNGGAENNGLLDQAAQAIVGLFSEDTVFSNSNDDSSSFGSGSSSSAGASGGFPNGDDDDDEDKKPSGGSKHGQKQPKGVEKTKAELAKARQD